MKPLVIATNTLRRFFRDRTALFFTVVLPVMIILVVGATTARFADQDIPVGLIAGGSAGSLATELVDALDAHDALAIERYDDREALAGDLRRGAVAAGVVIPADYDERLRSGRSADVELLIDQTRSAPVAVRSVVSDVAAEHGAAIQAASFATERNAQPFDANLETARRLADAGATTAVGVESEVVGERESDEGPSLAPGIGYQTPSMLILFVFITSMAGAALMIDSRKLGVTERMFSTPTAARSILLGETLARFGIAGAQAALIFVFGALVLDVDFGAPLGAALVILFFVGVGASTGLLVGSVFSTPEQAGSIGPPIGIAMGMLGGCMWPLEIVPEPMRVVGHAFPHAWAMDAWIELIGGNGGLGDITTELAVLAGFIAVILPVATWRLRRAIIAR